MTTGTRTVTRASLRVSSDPGHGGATAVYGVGRAGGSYEVSAAIGRSLPAPGERSFRPRRMVEALRKEDAEVEEFLRRLSAEHGVFELGDLPCPTVFLHPTFYRFDFTDAGGAGHGFEYSVEAGRHHGERHRGLVEEFEKFFEAERLARSFYEGRRDDALVDDDADDDGPPRRPTRPPREFW